MHFNSNHFPIKLVAFENYMREDDSPLYPMVIPVHLELTGNGKTSILESAFRDAMQSQPLLNARIQKQGRHWYWIETPPTTIQWVQSMPDSVNINLKQEAGVKIYALEKDGEFHVRLFFHHCIADGIGIVEFLEHWLKIYDRQAKTTPMPAPQTQTSHPASMVTPPEPPFGSAALVQRGKFGMSLWKYCLRPIQEFCGMIGVLGFFSRRPVAVGPQVYSKDFSATMDPQICYQSDSLTVDQTHEVMTNSKKRGYTVNDYFLAAVYSGCQSWLNDHAASVSDRFLRIMIPINMRKEAQKPLPTTNCVTMVHMDRRPKRSRSLDVTRWYVRLEMRLIKKLRSGLTFIHLIRLLGWMRKLPFMLRRDRCIATTIASNIGPLFQDCSLRNINGELAAGDLTLKSIGIFPPVRPFTWIAFLITTYGNEMQINTTYCGKALSEKDVAFVLQRVKNQLSKEST